jgi:hypothetical protein
VQLDGVFLDGVLRNRPGMMVSAGPRH